MSAALPAKKVDELAMLIRDHATVATGLGEWACKCSPMEWRPISHRSRHVAAAIAPIVAQWIEERP